MSSSEEINQPASLSQAHIDEVPASPIVVESSGSGSSDLDSSHRFGRQSMIKSNRKLKSPLKRRDSPPASGEFEVYANNLRREIEGGEECKRIDVIESLPLRMARDMLSLALVALRREREAREEAEFMFEQFTAITSEAQRQVLSLGSKKRKTPYDRPE